MVEVVTLRPGDCGDTTDGKCYVLCFFARLWALSNAVSPTCGRGWFVSGSSAVAEGKQELGIGMKFGL